MVEKTEEGEGGERKKCSTLVKVGVPRQGFRRWAVEYPRFAELSQGKKNIVRWTINAYQNTMVANGHHFTIKAGITGCCRGAHIGEVGVRQEDNTEGGEGEGIMALKGYKFGMVKDVRSKQSII